MNLSLQDGTVWIFFIVFIIYFIGLKYCFVLHFTINILKSFCFALLNLLIGTPNRIAQEKGVYKAREFGRFGITGLLL